MKTIIALSIVCLPLKLLTVTSPFGYRINPISGKIEFHNGVDLRAKYDTVYAVLNGIVRSECYNSSFGMAISLQNGEITSIYGHLDKFLVNAQDSVRAGQPIAISGSTGRLTAAHLHFSVRYQNRYINPLNFLYEILKTTNHEQKL
ncbi:M23 family metallopeptidase [Mucilaginibacter pocheonensis]|uniref:Murein DD-endopeptidase MepM/ murein hydrolase activator NlpD n=1 Tax=Mucilaginibacter pocheonensis TaxID=398050 RepID=A0ABU1TE78_9SPHI|nr:M23 family metallopeptidase [Mucilaginibacter pocheonensis]MDR6943667.1 murein DD-endopeptidase MepM/ murein hydrolase activator NlpD [Mucilaginibacter pocheonensis]